MSAFRPNPRPLEMGAKRPCGRVRPRTAGLIHLLSAVVAFTISSAGIEQGSASDETARETVVLLHGLGRTRQSMVRLEKHLSREGFHTVNLDYASRQYPVEQLAMQVAAHLNTLSLQSDAPVHFVTHSLGGILVRWLHHQKRTFSIGRVVMLAPPNQGSEVVDRLRHLPFFSRIMGPAVLELGTDRGGGGSRLGPAEFEVGVIAGNQTLNPLFSLWIPGPDDGKVSVESAKIEGMRDFFVVPASHAFIMNRQAVLEQVVYFLRNGRFRR